MPESDERGVINSRTIKAKRRNAKIGFGFFLTTLNSDKETGSVEDSPNLTNQPSLPTWLSGTPHTQHGHTDAFLFLLSDLLSTDGSGRIQELHLDTKLTRMHTHSQVEVVTFSVVQVTP